MSGFALQAKGLVKRFGALTAVAGVDLAVRRGECLALLGPNGAGKTTTVEMLEGLLPPDSGEIEVCGLPLPKRRREVMERVGIALQETNLYKRFTVRETLQLFASFFERGADVDTVMKKLSLGEKADAQLRTLSGGQKQRVHLGCALVNDPELLFLDEPTTGLDPQARRATWDLLQGVKAEGRSILLTTHYMEEAAALADRVAVMDHGRIIAEGKPRQLVHDICGEQVMVVGFGHADAAAEAAAKARVAERLPWFAAATAAPDEDGFAVTTADAARSTRELFAAAEAAGQPVASLRLRGGTLEDVFLKLTGRSMRDG